MFALGLAAPASAIQTCDASWAGERQRQLSHDRQLGVHHRATDDGADGIPDANDVVCFGSGTITVPPTDGAGVVVNGS